MGENMVRIGIVGATGLVGSKLIEIINKKSSDANYFLFASSRSVGSKIRVLGKLLPVIDVEKIMDYDLDYCIFVASNEISAKFVPLLIMNGTRCIDNSSYFRLDDDVPLVVDAVNGQLVKDKMLIANPNCSAVHLVTVLSVLKPYGIKRVVVSTYQSVSGAGKLALDDLNHACNYANMNSELPHPIHDNFFPHIDEFTDSGYTKEELKVMAECKKILQLPDLAITCNAVRIPVTVCHGAYMNIELSSEFDIDDIRRALSACPIVVVADDNEHHIYPMPLLARNTSNVYVGRIARDLSKDDTLNCFVVSDNLLRGAAYNAYEILLRMVNL
jgi:aspartate-semialdehyde dehydrogenase